jgi:Pyruvate/2-oxoacid:ferredoxin oxidoreductase delta subunit
VTSLLVGSIVEGVDDGTDNIEVDAKQTDEDPSDYRTRFDAALTEVENQAKSIWNDTHGCESCVAYWTDQGIDIDDSGGLVPVYKYCPDCQGQGQIM